MPLYEYSCSACAHRFERIVKFSDAPLKICPECGRETIEQLISAPAVQFKGSGWYVTDYARKTPGSSGSSRPEAGSSTGKDGASESSAAPASGSGSSDQSASGATPSSSTANPSGGSASSDSSKSASGNSASGNSGTKDK